MYKMCHLCKFFKGNFFLKSAQIKVFFNYFVKGCVLAQTQSQRGWFNIAIFCGRYLSKTSEMSFVSKCHRYQGRTLSTDVYFASRMSLKDENNWSSKKCRIRKKKLHSRYRGTGLYSPIVLFYS